MKRIALIVFTMLTLVSCTSKNNANVSALFPQNELFEDMGDDYQTVNTRRSLADKIDSENHYTYSEPLPDRYQIALKEKVSISGLSLFPVYSFISEGANPNGLVQVMFHGTSEDTALCHSALSDVFADFSSAYGGGVSAYGFENTLSEFMKKPAEEQIEDINGKNRISLNGYWTVKESFSSNPRIDLIAKVGFSADNIDETNKRGCTLNVYYQLIEVKDWMNY